MGGDRNANRVLKEMEPWLCTFRGLENIYYLSKAGRERVDCKKHRKISSQITHNIMKNEVYIHFGCPSTWKNETVVKLGVTRVKVDAMFQKDKTYHFVEVDREQKMITNKRKFEAYRKFNEQAKFRLIWITMTDYRKNKLLELCKGLDCLVYTVDDIK